MYAIRSYYVQYMLFDDNKKVIAITSSISGEGKTFCALNLAAVISMTHKKTLLIGLDLRKPKLHNNFKVSNDIGMTTYLIDKCNIEDIIFETSVEGLYFTPSGPT